MIVSVVVNLKVLLKTFEECVDSCDWALSSDDLDSQK